MKIQLKMKDGKVFYSGKDKKVLAAVKRINKAGGFPMVERRGDEEIFDIVEPTNKNLYLITNILPGGYEVE